MTNEIEQTQKTGNNCINMQAGRDIFNGVPEAELDKKIEEKCKTVALPMQRQICGIQQQIITLQNNLIEKTGIAMQKQQSRCNIFGKNFVLKLLDESDDKKEKIFKAFEEPDMQEAVCKAQHGYIISNDEDQLKILTDMLIDRGSISQRTNKQMLIDEAIDILPKLNQKHLDILAFYLLPLITHSRYNKNVIIDFIEKFITFFMQILPLGDDDNNLQYLTQKNCLKEYDVEITKLKSFEQLIMQKTELLHLGFSKKEYDELISQNVSDIPFANSLLKPENIVINTTLEDLQNILKNKNISKDDYDNIIHFWHRNKNEQDEELVKEYLLTNFDRAHFLFDNWSKIEKNHITLLGQCIALAYIKTKYNYNVNWNFE